MNVQEGIMMPAVSVTSTNVLQTPVSTADVKMVSINLFATVLQDMEASDVTLISMNVDQILVNMEAFALIC